MAENLDTPSFGNFSIENTMGAGNAELLNDLLAPETSTSSPDDIKEIKDEEPATPEPSKKSASKPAPAKASDNGEEKKDEEEANKKSLTDFLMGGGDEEESEEEEPSSKAAPKKQTPKEAEPEESETEDEEGSQEVSQFTALAKDLVKLGVFSQDDEDEEVEISTPEEFLERFQEEKKKGAIEVVNNFIGQFGEDYQQAFEAIFVKGVDPKEYFGAYNTAISFAEMDLSSESNQVTVLKQALADQGFDPEDVETEIERLKNYGDLETVATKHHKVLVKKEAAKLQQLEQESEKQLQQRQAIKNQYINNVQGILQDKLKSKEFDGIPLNPKLANELQDFLLVDRYRTNSGETITEFDRAILELKRPENHQMKVKLALIMKIMEKDPTLSTIQKTGISKKSNELFGEVARQVTKSSAKSSNSAQKSNSWFL
jgi:hypothetical protein